ncbi:hypothetical protein V8G54_033334 [Vigna mungo]|uniref:Uncharacterized protein n=1 Tax=Vigna mungo TaxID=3915 RepID=A0AAQ3MN23_VIGMU
MYIQPFSLKYQSLKLENSHPYTFYSCLHYTLLLTRTLDPPITKTGSHEYQEPETQKNSEEQKPNLLFFSFVEPSSFSIEPEEGKQHKTDYNPHTLDYLSRKSFRKKDPNT